MNRSDTIAAVATPPGQGGIGIVRVSGPDVWALADALFQPGKRPSAAPSGTFLYGRVIDGAGAEIDTGLCLIFRAPKSYTGEDSIEIQGHGGPVVLKKILRRCLELGARPAAPGEFTQRAFLNGKMDLLQAEAVADLIRAQSDRSAGAALEQLEGNLSRRFNDLYDLILEAAADLETTLDFAEDELPEEIFAGIAKKMDTGLTAVRRLLSTWDEGQLLREGARVVLTGRPNAGKSTLFNALLEQDRAIVTDLPGTTRDVIEETLVLDGIPLRILDTAGLRETECRIEQEGIRRTRLHSAAADITVYIVDTSAPFAEEDAEHLRRLNPRRTVLVLNKTDRKHYLFHWPVEGFDPLEVSLLTGSGLQTVRQAVVSLIQGKTDFHAPVHAVISERHRNLLESAGQEIELAQERIETEGETGAASAAEHLRAALEALGQVTGRIYHHELLNSVFSRFCIGK